MGLFEDLPPPSAPPPSPPAPAPAPLPLPPPAASILKKDGPKKSALKRPAPDGQGPKQVRFKTGVDTSKEKVMEAVQKISKHIGNADREKFSKVCKLAIQLIQAGGVTKEVVEPFFGILETAMTPPSKANAAGVRADYSALFSAVHDKLELFTPAQQARIEIWMIWAQLANEFHTDDTFMFSKAASRLKQFIESLPDAIDEESSSDIAETRRDDVDPFGLDALLPGAKETKEGTLQEAGPDLLKDRREALVECLKIAVSRYKMKWAQTIIDIAAKHAVDHRHKFGAAERRTVEKLWSSVKEQQIKRKQGKALAGKLDETPFERLSENYSTQKISIRKAVGSGGERSAEQWLG